LSAVHCARCNGRVPLGLTVCPHCGRDVHPAGPRWGLWIAGFIVVALAALWGLGELPVERVAEQVSSIETRVAGLIKVFGPAGGSAAEASPTPRAVARVSSPTTTATTRPTRTPTEAPTATIAPAVEVTATVSITATAAISVTAPLTTSLATETPAFTPTMLPTATAAPTETPTSAPTATPTTPPTNTPVPGRVTYKVKSGDTLSSIAAQFGIAWQDLAAANGLNSGSTLRVGQELIVPVPGSSSAPAPAQQGTTQTTYTVKSGDSLSSIATQFGITWQELAQANGLTGASRLNVGQKLVIPGTGGSSQPAPTATRAPVAAATRAPTPTPGASLPQVSAPLLVSPSDQTPYSGPGSYIELVWEQSADLPQGAQYQVLIRWSEGGVPMEYGDMRTTAKSIRMPLWLYGKADQPSRQYSWSVRVVQSVTDGQGGQKDILLSPSSASRVLYWN
jgi:LysM repeat protein